MTSADAAAPSASAAHASELIAIKNVGTKALLILVQRYLLNEFVAQQLGQIQLTGADQLIDKFHQQTEQLIG